ncbi:NYN domain-containing protein [Methylomonas sp. EFPC3]|uniref:LabA-like NYN domain-containing protein n=1 Tax=Methylomonas TaxID=416 RepID=UPI00112E7FB7|nr:MULTISPECIES: NYN domain-containing protein [Methylomonas]TPQ26058.1 nuclease [Methylomonas koyamae]WFP51162.1 NYN domain-containing protein [Methylomonas sp. EFPC3]
MERVAIFADVQNIYYTTRERYQKHFNYTAFWRHATNDKQVVAAFAYAIDRGDSKQQSFQNILKTIGFTVKLKPYIQRRDGSTKGDWDVGITVDVLDFARQVDRVVLLSGDGDFEILLNKVRRDFGVACDVYGVRSLTAPALIAAADNFVAIAEALLL